MELNHCMIDLETMGLNEDAPIVSIGAVIFDPRHFKVSNETFYVELDWRSQGRCEPDSETKLWWSNQSNEAKISLEGKGVLEDALFDLQLFMPSSDVKVWGNGPTFDITKLDHAYRQHNMDVPWKFWNIRDCRTIRDIYESKRGGLSVNGDTSGAHNALQDAVVQAELVCRLWSKLNIS